MEETRHASHLPDLPGIYQFVKDDEIVYIGQSTSIKRRVNQHMLSNGDDVSFKYEIIEDEKERKKKEKKLIREKQPEFNSQESFQPEVDLPSYLETAETFEEKVETISEMTRLSDREAELYVLHAGQGKSLSQAAEEMGTAKNTEKGRWSRIKEKIWKAEETAELTFP